MNTKERTAYAKRLGRRGLIELTKKLSDKERYVKELEDRLQMEKAKMAVITEELRDRKCRIKSAA
jgi:hypothetical protein